MMRSVPGIDHTLVGVRDLEGARGTWTGLGFTTSPRGSHIEWGTANYCIMFPDDYVELIGIVDPARFTNNLDKFLAEREGLMGLAFASTDAADTAAELRERGIPPDGPGTLKRRLELPEGAVLPEFELVFVPAEATPGLRAFFCHHRTPDLMRRPEWLAHANGAIGLAGITVAVDSVAGFADAYARLFGSVAVEEEPGALYVSCGPAQIAFLERPVLARHHPDLAADGEGGLPRPVLMTVRVRDEGDTLAFLDRADIPHSLTGPDLAVVPPSSATGVAVGFTA